MIPSAAPSPEPTARTRRFKALPIGAWTTAGLVAAAAAVALWAIGQGRLRELRPADTPTEQAPPPSATAVGVVGMGDDEGGDRPSGRLIVTLPGDEHAVIAALDMRTGREERLWDAPTRSDVHGVVSPDGSRLAIARRPDGEASGLVYVRHLDAAAPEPLALAGPDDVRSLVWAPDGTALYYDEILWSAPSGDAAMPSPVGWELHRLTLRDDVPNLEPRPMVGPLSAGIQAGADQVIIRLDAAALGDVGVAELLALDARHERAAVVSGLGENAWADGMTLFDTATGAAVEGEPIPAGQIEGFRYVANHDGTKVAYTNCLGCNDGPAPYSLRILTLATGEVAEVWSGSDPQLILASARLLWSPDDRWLFWTAHGTTRVADLTAPATTFDLPTTLGHPIVFAPGGARLLLSTGQLLDLNAAPPPEWLPEPLPWTMPAWLTEWNEIGRVIAWAPDVGRTAVVPTETREAQAASIITPVATVTFVSSSDVTASPVLDMEAWSPDSRWLPFWTADGSDHYEYWKWPAALNFVDASTGVVCRVPGVARTTHSDAIFWEDDGRVAVRTEGRVSVGRPCDAVEPDPQATYALPTAPPGATPGWADAPPHEGSDYAGAEASGPSLDGSFLATTTATGDKDDHYVTRITRVADGAVVAETAWRSNGGLGSMGLGGEWLPSGAFLVGYSVDRGPLIIETDGTVTDAATELFELVAPSADVPNLGAWAVIHPDGRTWHAFLTGSGNVRLHHPESQSTETLPSVDLWGDGFSADGRWLTLHGRDGESGSNDGLWIRGIDDIGAPFRMIAESGHVQPYNGVLSPDGATMAFLNTNAGYIAVVPFPEGDVVGRWHLAGYEAGSARWSPDGRSIAIDGYRHDDDGGIAERALFILTLPPEP